MKVLRAASPEKDAGSLDINTPQEDSGSITTKHFRHWPSPTNS